MRFFLDQHINIQVARLLRTHKHECWTAAEAGLSAEGDDELTVYADKMHAVLVTRDEEFSQRRRRNVIGKHLWIDCARDRQTAPLLAAHLKEVVDCLDVPSDLWVRLHPDGIETSRSWR